MRELIYLSQRKLDQFQSDRRGGSLIKRVREFGIKAPLALGEVQVGLGDEIASRYGQLDKVLKELDRSERAAQWYEADGLTPGDWVQFECRLAYTIVKLKRSRHTRAALIFWQPLQTEGPTVRLVLHGDLII